MKSWCASSPDKFSLIAHTLKYLFNYLCSFSIFYFPLTWLWKSHALVFVVIFFCSLQTTPGQTMWNFSLCILEFPFYIFPFNLYFWFSLEITNFSIAVITVLTLHILIMAVIRNYLLISLGLPEVVTLYFDSRSQSSISTFL